MNPKIVESLVLALGLMAISLSLAWAGKTGLVTNDIPIRISMALSGLLIAYYGNAVPKVLIRSARARAVRRFAGWAFVLAGLVTAALWAAAPQSVATPFTLAALGTAVALVFGACVLSRLIAPAPTNGG